MCFLLETLEQVGCDPSWCACSCYSLLACERTYATRCIAPYNMLPGSGQASRFCSTA